MPTDHGCLEYTINDIFFFLSIWMPLNATASVRGKLVYANKSVVGGCLLPLFLETKQQPPVFFRFRRPFLFAWDSHRLTDLMVIDCFLERRPKTYNPSFNQKRKTYNPSWKYYFPWPTPNLNFRPYNHYSCRGHPSSLPTSNTLTSLPPI